MNTPSLNLELQQERPNEAERFVERMCGLYGGTEAMTKNIIAETAKWMIDEYNSGNLTIGAIKDTLIKACGGK